MKKPKPPNTIQEVENYCKERGLCIDPSFFWEFFSANDWKDSNDKPVLCWKQKALTWHRANMERGKRHRCSVGGCKQPGVYIAGRDDSGQAYFRCIDHKPGYKPSIPDMSSIFKPVPGGVDINDARNKQRNLLGRN